MPWHNPVRPLGWGGDKITREVHQHFDEHHRVGVWGKITPQVQHAEGGAQGQDQVVVDWGWDYGFTELIGVVGELAGNVKRLHYWKIKSKVRSRRYNPQDLRRIWTRKDEARDQDEGNQGGTATQDRGVKDEQPIWDRQEGLRVVDQTCKSFEENWSVEVKGDYWGDWEGDYYCYIKGWTRDESKIAWRS